MLILRSLEVSDFAVISNTFLAIGWNKPSSLFERYFWEQTEGLRFCFVAFYEGVFAGYVSLLKKSVYEYFMAKNILEISDLNVLPNFRKRGVGTALIQKCEKIASDFSSVIGLGVGLTSDYADALNLYLSLGYKLDGNGLAYNGKRLNYGSSAVVDDELNLYLVKNLK
jgi:GNAT superfamily N-acetyltransferase